jgi:small-conductance mechanosensitive channel
MHERHVLYRVETTAKWNLHPNAPATVALGPAVEIIDPAHQNGPTTAEVIAEVNRQKAATQTIIDQGKRLNNTLTQVSTALDASKQVAEQNRQLRTEIDLTKQRLDLLETEIRNQQQASPAQRGTPENTNQNW